MWANIGALARALSQLQKVDVELAATSGHRNRGIAYALCPRYEVYVTCRGAGVPEIPRNPGKSESLRNNT
jgi:hypothetical protein